MNRFIYLLLIIACATLSPASYSAVDGIDYTEQRRDFLAARNALYKGQYTKFKQLSADLKDYPLYPYLRYAWLRKRLYRVPKQEILEFLIQYEAVPVSPLLRNAWLKRLAKKGHWKDFLSVYRPTSNTKLQCSALRARLATGDTEEILDDIEELWLVGYSQPSECDPAFDYLYKSENMRPALTWQRIHLAMDKGHTSLAVYLAKRLNAEDQEWVNRWRKVHRDPIWHLRHTRYKDSSLVRDIYLHAIKRVARRKLSTAYELWTQLKKRHKFSTSQISSIDRRLALKAARNKDAKAWEWISEFSEADDDKDARYWRIRTALFDQNWPAVRRLIAVLPGDERSTVRWRYWRARALENTGYEESALKIYQSIAGKRDYHGFLAADRLGVDYTYNHQATNQTAKDADQLSQLPALIRARDLFMTSRYIDARREWRELTRDMSTRHLELVSAIAHEFGWHDRAILTVAKAGEMHDLDMRFPILFDKHVNRQAKRFKIDPAWVYGVIRQESIFMHDARSSAGARGLMQIMPSTGRAIARRLHVKKHKTSKLGEPAYNIQFGASYLKQMLDKFHSKALATAAYNAGPLRIKQWRPEAECTPADIWNEVIPFNETRRYLRRVLAYTVIYDWKLNGKAGRITQLMPPVASNASHDCQPGN